MKKHLLTILASVVAIACLLATMTAPWWVVWLVLYPITLAAVFYIIKTNTNYIEEY